ncbi:shikimate dehydrogenase [Paraburkholderia sp. GAS199]|uniref:shikimate dehydrogenase family protein n=1 Tax=Paraburkholderia sp. GAS199 TaxID=3035126 RepID=UPI003D1D97F8
MNSEQTGVAQINGNTRVIVLMAWPASHVRTPAFFNAICRAREINAVMVPWAVSPERLAQAWEGLRYVDNLAGIVLTIPHKQTAAKLCDTLEGDAALLEVVNTVRRNADGTFTGRMYDGVGFVAGMLAKGIVLTGKRVLLLGAGGAAMAIALALARQDVATLTIANRSAQKAGLLAEAVTGEVPHAIVQTGSADPSGHDIVINATSLGLKPGDALPCDVSRLERGMVVADVIMQPAVTPLLVAAAGRGMRIHEGEHMVVPQLELFEQFLLNPASPD